MRTAAERPEVSPGDILTPSGRVIKEEEFVDMAAAADYVLLGEGHTVACDHEAHARMLRALAARRPGLALGLEMVSIDRQPVLDRFNSGELTPDTLPEVLDWNKTWGYPYSLYEPVFRVAAGKGIAVFAANTPTRVIRSRRKNGVASEDRAYLPDEIIPPADEQIEVLTQVFEAHAPMREDGPDNGEGDGADNGAEREADEGKAADSAGAGEAVSDKRGDKHAKDDLEENEEDNAMAAAGLRRFLETQSIWDTIMAERATGYKRKGHAPVAIKAGSGHVEYGWGVAHRLRALDPDASVLIVMPWRGREGMDSDMADLFFFCPLKHSSRLGFTIRWDEDYPVITNVKPESSAGRAGLRAGDVVLAAMDEQVDTSWSLHTAAMKAMKQDSPLRLAIERAGERMTIAIEFGHSQKDGAPQGGSEQEPAPGPKVDDSTI